LHPVGLLNSSRDDGASFDSNADTHRSEPMVSSLESAGRNEPLSSIRRRRAAEHRRQVKKGSAKRLIGLERESQVCRPGVSVCQWQTCTGEIGQEAAATIGNTSRTMGRPLQPHCHLSAQSSTSIDDIIQPFSEHTMPFNQHHNRSS
jgi:hypothetical protein